MPPEKSDTDPVRLAVMGKDIEYIRRTVEEIEKTVKENYVTKTEFDPIKRLVYGFVGLILLGVVGAILALVVKTSQ